MSVTQISIPVINFHLDIPVPEEVESEEINDWMQVFICQSDHNFQIINSRNLKMFKLVLAFALIAVVAAFVPAASVARRSALKMSASSLPGVTSPFGFFDPLGFAAGKTDAEIKKFREAELKHGKLLR